MLRKLIEKVIEEIIQFHTISNNFIYPYQFGGLKQQSTSDIGTFLTYIIQLGWIKNTQTSTLTFDITQFFPSLNYHLFSLLLVRFNPKVSKFFSNYLIGKKNTVYVEQLFLFFF